ncbi:DUF1269 domain-containing protein [Pseudaminobacter sp. 19-2017]|uniref:DUF1269 domain-containing protein n=1 Tax=Pseudaminobacter soli (ex Zhang et al. 2022) TaxID=2831468 RepID=A0A942I2V7_9HYPH|nr:DUF1269 domain-containing protein [Pseudaminobacter soli]
MSRFVVVIFPNEEKADEGVRLLDELDNEGTITVYATAIVSKNSDGEVTQKETRPRGPRGMVLGALVGGLLGMLGGPPVAALGAAGGAVMGGWHDAMDLGVGFDFLDEVSRELRPGHWAVVATIDEEWITPLDSRMESIGGIVVRRRSDDFEDDRLRGEIELARRELSEYQAELAQAPEKTKARLATRIDEVRAKLRRAAERTESRIDRLRQETEAKVGALEHQAVRAAPDAKASIDRRIANIRVDDERRSSKLEQALAMAREAAA